MANKFENNVPCVIYVDKIGHQPVVRPDYCKTSYEEGCEGFYQGPKIIYKVKIKPSLSKICQNWSTNTMYTFFKQCDNWVESAANGRGSLFARVSEIGCFIVLS